MNRKFRNWTAMISGSILANIVLILIGETPSVGSVGVGGIIMVLIVEGYF